MQKSPFSPAGVSEGYHAEGPPEVLRGNLTGHAHTNAPLAQDVGRLGALVAGDPAALCRRERKKLLCSFADTMGSERCNKGR